jgi:hypothetical protein
MSSDLNLDSLNYLLAASSKSVVNEIINLCYSSMSSSSEVKFVLQISFYSIV